MKHIVINLLSRFDVHMLEVLHGAGSAFIVKLLAAGALFGFNVVLARLLGSEGVGIFFLANTIIIVTATLGRLGFDNALIRVIAASVEGQRYESVLGVFKKVLNIGFVGAMIISATVYFLAPWISMTIFSKPDIETPLRVMALSIVPLVLLSLHAFALQGLKRPAAHVAVLSLWVPLISMILASVFAVYYGVVGASYSYLVATIIALFVGRMLWKRSTNQYKNIVSNYDLRELFNVSMPLYLVTVMDMVISWTPLLLLGVWDSSANVGIFNAATRVAMLTGFVLMAVNSIAAPKIAELFQRNDLCSLEKVSQNSTTLMMSLSLPVLLLFIIIPESVMAMFGHEFEKGANVLVILAVGQFVNAATGPVGYLLMMTGNERIMRNNMMMCALLMCLLSSVLIPALGIIGAAISYSVTVATQNLLGLYFVKKKLGIMVISFFSKR